MNNLKELRIRRNLTQKMLAEQLKMSQQALSRLERGERELTETGIKIYATK